MQPYLYRFVTAQIIQDDDVTGLQRWQQELLDMGPEALAVDRPALLDLEQLSKLWPRHLPNIGLRV